MNRIPIKIAFNISSQMCRHRIEQSMAYSQTDFGEVPGSIHIVSFHIGNRSRSLEVPRARSRFREACPDWTHELSLLPINFNDLATGTAVALRRAPSCTKVTQIRVP